MSGAYQRLELTARPPMFDAMDQLGQTMAGFGNDLRQDRQYGDQQKRQKQQDYQAAMAKASELWAKGDRQGAYALLAPYNDPSAHDEPPPAPPPPQGLPSHIPPQAAKVPPAPQPQPQGGSPMPDGMEFPQGAAPGSMPSLGALGAAAAQHPGPSAPAPGSSPMLGAMGNAANQGPIDPGMVDSLPMGGGPPPGPAMAPGQGPPPAGPPPVQAQLMAAQEATKARDAATNQRRAMHLLAPGGQHVTWDPQGQQESIRAEKLSHMDAVVAESQDPLVAKYYPQLRPFLASAESDWHPAEVLRFIHQQEAGEAATKAAEAKATTAAGVWEDRKQHWATADTTTRRGQDMTLEGRKAMAMNFGAGNPLRVDASNRGDTGHLETAIKDVVAMADGKALVKSNRALNQAIVNIAAEGPKAVTQHKDAFLQLERYFKGGGTPTEGEAILLLHHMGGIPGAVKQYLADVKTGDFSQITIDNLAQAATAAKHELDGNVNAFMGALRERTGPGTEFEGMGSNVNHMVKTVGRIYGMDLPDVHPGEAGKNQVKLGSGLRSPAAADPAPGTRAPAKKPKSAPAESEEVTWAKAHINSTTPAHGSVLEKDVAADILRKQGAKR